MTAEEQRESAASRPDAARDGLMKGPEMTIWTPNPQANLPDVVPKASARDASSSHAVGQPHTEDHGLVVLVDHDNFRAQLWGVLGRAPYPEELLHFRKLREFFTQWLRGHTRGEISCHWLLHGWDTSMLSGLIGRLEREKLGPKVLSRNQPTALNCACSALRKSIRFFTSAGRSADLLVGSNCRLVARTLISAANEHPDRRFGVLAYREILPRDYAETGIDLLDIEYDAEAHDPSISREFASAGDQFDPATLLSRG